ncbi:MAG: DUF5615 family PIN-like protein [Acidimicrobiales bacterium]
MKLLLDQNLSPSLVPHLADFFPETTNVSRLGLGRCCFSGQIASAGQHTCRSQRWG